MPDQPPPVPVLTGTDVVLREFRDSDLPRVVEACHDPRTQHWLGQMPSPYTEDDARAWLASIVELGASGERITWAVTDPESDELLGCINIFELCDRSEDQPSQGEVGYWAHPDARGRGLMTQACALVLDHGFAELGLDRIIGHTALDNTASQRVLEANGMTQARVVPDGTTLRTGPADAALFVREAGSDAETTTGLHADDAEVHQHRKVLLPRTTLALRPGQVAVVRGRPGSSHTALALALAGRLPLDSGQVSLDGDQQPATLQRAVALVDVPGVSEPDDTVPLHTIVGEELAMAGRRASRDDVRRLLAEEGLAEHRDSPMDEVPSRQRLGTLARLAASRPGTRYLVLTCPERHGLPPGTWLELARELAADGPGVLVTASEAVDLPDDVPLFTIGPELGPGKESL